MPHRITTPADLHRPPYAPAAISLVDLGQLDRGLAARMADLNERVGDALNVPDGPLDDALIGRVDVLCAAISELEELRADVRRDYADERRRRRGPVTASAGSSEKRHARATAQAHLKYRRALARRGEARHRPVRLRSRVLAPQCPHHHTKRLPRKGEPAVATQDQNTNEHTPNDLPVLTGWRTPAAAIVLILAMVWLAFTFWGLIGRGSVKPDTGAVLGLAASLAVGLAAARSVGAEKAATKLAQTFAGMAGVATATSLALPHLADIDLAIGVAYSIAALVTLCAAASAGIRGGSADAGEAIAEWFDAYIRAVFGRRVDTGTPDEQADTTAA